MNGSFIPYHLRQNKAIDRNLFVEALSMINRVYPIKDYQYISMGGPFLEDFKVVHAATGIKKMISFESRNETFRRQKFNCPLNCIDLLEADSTSFIHDHSFDDPTIIWLDFTTTLDKCLSDIFELAAKLKEGDIVKLTFNADAASIHPIGRNRSIAQLKERLLTLDGMLGAYLPTDADHLMVTDEKYPDLLFRMVELVIDRAMGKTGKLFFQPLTAYVYADSARMLTCTGIVLNRTKSMTFLNETGIRKWKLGVVGKSRPLPISVPELSIKERMFLDALLPKSGTALLQKRLKHLIAPKDDESLEGIRNYAMYYRQFPYFSKITF